MNKHSPYLPVPWEDADASAIRAVMLGEATSDQQRRAMKWIIETCCGTYDLPYREDDRDTAFACGKMFVGQQIIALPQKLLIVKTARRKS